VPFHQQLTTIFRFFQSSLIKPNQAISKLFLMSRTANFTLTHDGETTNLKKPPQSQRPPPVWRGDIRSVLISRARLARRVRTLARQIEKDFAGRDLVIVALLNGTVIFLADLLRAVSLPLRLDFIGVSSYRDATVPGGLVFTKELRLDVRGRDVLLVDDILDTGRTLSRVRARLLALQPRHLKICVLLDKPSRRLEDVPADYVGFTIPDEFVVGYGLDYAEKYRNLPFVGLLHPKIARGLTP
jgi:hypoxanthine phosphoribosyltransferase